MDADRAAAILLIAGFVVLAIAWPLGVPGLYAKVDIDERLRRIDAYRTRWLLTQWAIVLYALLAGAGFVALAASLSGGTVAGAAGALAIVLGSISGVYFVYLQTTDPRGGYSGKYPWPETLAYWLWLAGMLLVGIALLQSNAPAWLGYLAVGSVVVFSVFYAVTRAGFLTPGLVAVLELVIGVVLLTR